MIAPAHLYRAVTDNRVIEAAICRAGRLPNIESHYSPITLEESDQRFPRGCGLNQAILTAAASAGYRSMGESKVTLESHNYAFGFSNIFASGFSNISLPTVLSNVANKFLRAGWDSADLTPLRIASIRPVTDLKTITTVSLVGDVAFQRLAPTGEIVHGNLGEAVYANKADTYARMLAITRADLINDDLGALVNRAKQLGRGAALMLNRIFWSKFLDNASFFSSVNNNVSTGVLGVDGLTAADVAFASQRDPDGNPLGVQPSILLVPTPLRTTAFQLMNSEALKGSSDGPDANPFRGRFSVESSPYLHDAAFVGHSPAAFYLLASPDALPVIEIAALDGRVEPVIESADADFNVLGVQMRGYSDVGVALQEHRGGVRSSGTN